MAVIVFFWQVSNLISIISGSLYVKTDRDVIRQALKLAELKKGDVFYDLGSGNGDVLIEAAKFGAKATGFEISPYYYILGKLRTWQNKNIKIRFQNIKDVSLSQADIVYCYLLPKMLEKLAPKFKKDLKSGAKIISIGFPIKNLKPSRKIVFENRAIFIYF